MAIVYYLLRRLSFVPERPLSVNKVCFRDAYVRFLLQLINYRISGSPLKSAHGLVDGRIGVLIRAALDVRRELRDLVLHQVRADAGYWGGRFPQGRSRFRTGRAALL